jgi:hypothetical protein
MAAKGRRIVLAVPELTGLTADELIERMVALQAFLETVRDSLDEGEPPGRASGTAGLPENVDGTSDAAIGTSSAWSASDHKHDADVSGTPGGVAATSVQGTGSGLARTDHAHRFSLLTAKGDLVAHNGTDPVRVAVGTNGYILQADSTQTPGVKWNPTSGLIVLTAGRFVYTDSGGLLTTNAAFLVDDSGGGGGILTLRKSPSGTQAVLLADNGATAAPILIARDNGAALPTTGPTATWAVLDGAWSQQGNGVLTSATATAVVQGRESGSLIHSYEWTNAMITALGGGGVGDVSVCTLPAKTVVKNAYVVIVTPDTSANALTVALGRTGAAYIDYIVASDAKAAASTVYGDAAAERGTNLTGYDLPSYTGTTTVNLHFIKTTTALNTVTGCTGRVIIETATVP